MAALAAESVWLAVLARLRWTCWQVVATDASTRGVALLFVLVGAVRVKARVLTITKAYTKSCSTCLSVGISAQIREIWHGLASLQLHAPLFQSVLSQVGKLALVLLNSSIGRYWRRKIFCRSGSANGQITTGVLPSKSD